MKETCLMHSVFAAILAILPIGIMAMGCSSGNHQPVFFPIGNKSISTGATLEFTVIAVDDDQDQVVIGIDGKPQSANFQDLGNSSARFSWTPLASDAGEGGSHRDWPVTFMVTDGKTSTSEAIIITVTLGGAGTGAPVFLTPSDHTLDLSRKSQIKFNVEVRDADSANVDLRQLDSIVGGEFQTSPGAKMAAFRWEPSAAQIAERPIWSFRVGATDDSNPEVVQDLTILIKGGSGGQQKCDGTSPSIVHQALSDQKGAGDYQVVVNASDAESEVVAVSLYWKVDRGDDASSSFEKLAMSSQDATTWNASIPNPGLQEGQTAVVTYYVCALDDDDPSGSECDRRICAPDDGRYAFTAYPPGATHCEEDDLEPNDSSEVSTGVEFDQSGESYLEMKKLCPGNEDWYRMVVPGGYQMGALLGFASKNGQLQMELYDQDGTTRLLPGEHTEDLVALFPDSRQQEQVYYLRVYGANAMVENGYDLYVVVEIHESCTLDSLEPNDSPQGAKLVVEHEYIGLTSCGEPDWYRVDMNQGDTLEVLLEFEHTDGDLDLAVFDPAVVHMDSLSFEHAMSFSSTENDDEYVSVSIPVDNSYYIRVSSYQGAKASYQMLVVLTPFAGCVPDDLESNNTPQNAEGLWPTRYENLTICPLDEDWFFMYLNAGETLGIDLTFTHADGDLDVILYDEGVLVGDPVEHELDGGMSTDDNESIRFPIQTSGNYYFAVSAFRSASNTYTLDVSAQ